MNFDPARQRAGPFLAPTEPKFAGGPKACNCIETMHVTVNCRSSSRKSPMSPEKQDGGQQLPSPGERWVPRRKAMVIAALRAGETTIEEVCSLYRLSPDELAGWISSFERYGVPGLRATRVQIYRDDRSVAAGHERAGEPAIVGRTLRGRARPSFGI